MLVPALVGDHDARTICRTERFMRGLLKKQALLVNNPFATHCLPHALVSLTIRYNIYLSTFVITSP